MFPRVVEFLKTHAKSRTYFFQVLKCEQNDCRFHSPRRGTQPIRPFPDPVPYDDNGIERYKEGVDNDEKYLPSKLQDVTKQAHRLPFSPTAQTAKNTGLTVKCCHCKKPRLLYSPKKLKENSLLELKKMLNDVLYVCGTSFREY